MLGVYNGSFMSSEPSLYGPVSYYIGDDITPVNAGLYAGTYNIGGGLLATVTFGNFEIDPTTGTYDGFGVETISFTAISSVTTTPSGDWIPHSPPPGRPNTTPPTDQQKLTVVKVVGLEASHDLGCVVNAEAGMIPFAGDLMDNGSQSPLNGADKALGKVGEAGIVASFFNNGFSAAVEGAAEKLAPIGTAVSTVNAAMNANACINNGPE